MVKSAQRTAGAKALSLQLARQACFGVTAFAFTNASGQTTYGCYRILPEAGNDFLSGAQAAPSRLSSAKALPRNEIAVWNPPVK